ncbi:RNA polymerase sigma factor [Salipiger sp. P9]|uniref:RNA polymerase sigma factor n=1 Tax=Salipiger pentaromativorans TaxID=2943193 RepID=UPI0021583723|nr:RNA polymerase sigma factor [Salipiger pentaromativorans]MCR8550150.1 RNA polymerase sigma factor [Salipiger pentaromativorans]
MSADPRDEIVEHIPALRAFALSLTRNGAVADDMVQDTLVKAWTKIGTFEPGTNMRAWLFTILRNTYYSNRRKAGREVSDADGIFTESLSEKPAHDGRLQLADFRRAFVQLNDEQREALILVGAQGFSYEDAAETCGVAVGTIKSRVNRARARLAELLKLDDEDELEMTDQATMAVVAAGRAGGALG